VVSHYVDYMLTTVCLLCTLTDCAICQMIQEKLEQCLFKLRIAERKGRDQKISKLTAKASYIIIIIADFSLCMCV
jgi:hypothetical protein